MSDIVLSKFPLSCYNCILIHNCNYPPLHYYYHIAMYTVKILVTIRINTVLCSICYIDSNGVWAHLHAKYLSIHLTVNTLHAICHLRTIMCQGIQPTFQNLMDQTFIHGNLV